MPNSYEFQIKWYQRLSIKALAFFVLLAITVIGVTIMTMSIASQEITEHLAYEKLRNAQQQVITGLSERTKVVSTLASTMASIAVHSHQVKPLFHQTITNVINNAESKPIVVGGGIWPEPYAFDKTKIRDSYFWSRDQNGNLDFYNDYNQAEGNGYHREEWYVPSRYLQAGQVYWSKSYIDPHSLQSMVTVTAPMVLNGAYLGATTIDLKLDGLHALLKDSTARFNGYAFAMDRNGNLLSFPDEKMARPHTSENSQHITAPFLTITQLAQKHIAFRPFSSHINDNHITIPTTTGNDELYILATKIAEQSYQITLDEALAIAHRILFPIKAAVEDDHSKKHVFPLTKDYFLDEAAFASVTTMPTTGWYIFTVIPVSEARKSSERLISTLSLSIVVIMLIAIILAGLLLKRIYADPLKELMQKLKQYIDKEDSDSFINVNNKGEFGELAHWFNQRTNELLATKEQVNSLAFYDPLTGLPNRKMLKIHIDKKLISAQKHKTCGAIIFLDLDHFKVLNDSLGHDSGDQLLIEFRKRLDLCLRKGDMAGRFGGDEFVIVLSLPIFKDHNKTKIPSAIAKQILSSLSEPFLLAGNMYHITASIGIAIFDEDSSSTEDILKYADSAMYNSKSNGRNTYCFFENGMQIKADQRLRIEKDLRHAIDNDGLSLAFQPQLTTENKCPSLEVLVRWIHPKEGFISPLDFISIAEESMLILSLGDWVVKHTCAQMKAWEKQGIIFDHVSINISPIQFQQVGFVHHIAKTIRESGVRPEQVMIELTEGVIIDNPDRVVEKICRLKKMGLRVSIDDFGTGYSSLNYLKRLPLDELKIDRSFIQEITNDHSDVVITETIISMAKNFGYTVIAEGVETVEQKEILIDKGCRYFQGFLFSKPLPPSDIPEYLKQLTPSSDADSPVEHNP
ncbi:MAG: diguanylate cyclase (GGDEF)-like protein [Candidatus Endobugula sp.]